MSHGDGYRPERFTRDIIVGLIGSISAVIILQVIGGPNQILFWLQNIAVQPIHLLLAALLVILYIDYQYFPDVRNLPFHTVNIDDTEASLTHTRPENIYWRGYVRTGDDGRAWPVEYGQNEATGETEVFVFNQLCYDCGSEVSYDYMDDGFVSGYSLHAQCPDCEEAAVPPADLVTQKRNIAKFTATILGDALVGRATAPTEDREFIETVRWSPPPVATSVNPWYADFDYGKEKAEEGQ